MGTGRISLRKRNLRLKDKKKAYYKEWYADRRKKGLCIYCPRKALEGLIYCRTHQLRNTESMRRRHSRLKDADRIPDSIFAELGVEDLIR